MRLRFAPKVPVGWLEQLYRRDALGIQDEDLVDKVAARLYARCRDVLLVSDSRVECLECGTVFEVPWIGQPPSLARHCPGCGWTITAGEYHASFEHQDVLGINARAAFSEFVALWPRSTGYRERMLLVDRLVHAAHAGGNSVARNLIEGRAREVLARLEALAQRWPRILTSSSLTAQGRRRSGAGSRPALARAADSRPRLLHRVVGVLNRMLGSASERSYAGADAPDPRKPVSRS